MTQSGIHQISAGSVHAFLVDGDDGLVLIDTGFPKKHGAILDKISEIGRTPEDLKAILLTHSHADHSGGAARIKQRSGASLLASPVDTPAIQGEEPPPPPPMARGLFKYLFRLLPGAEPVVVDAQVSESEDAGLPEDFSVLDTPGHTPGHVCYLLDRGQGILFAGDLAVAQKDGTVAKGFFNRHNPIYNASVIHASRRDFGQAFFAHSRPINQDASGALRRFAATLD